MQQHECKPCKVLSSFHYITLICLGFTFSQVLFIHKLISSKHTRPCWWS